MFYDPMTTPELSPVPVGWAQREDVVQQHLQAFQQVLAHQWDAPLLESPTGGQAAPVGILYIGGGVYWPGIVVGIRMLRESGCQLPVQVWHRGNEEPVEVSQIHGLGDVTVIDLVQHARAHGGARILRGWECKLHALSYCGFARVMYLDADAYVVSDPTPFIQELDAAPFVFWNDLPFNYSTVKWPTVWPAGSAGVPAIQGGQLAIDRVRGWRTVMLAHWMNQHSDYYYSHMFGDQDTWRVALAAQNDPSQWATLGAAPWQNTAFVCPTRDGVKRIVHRCQGKLFRPRDIPVGKSAYSSPQYALPKETNVFNHLAQVLQQDTGDCQTVFGDVYRNKLWGDGSGPGSLGEEATLYVNLINTLLTWGGVQSVVDMGCGDGSIARSLAVQSVVGIDCHKEHIDRLRIEAPAIRWQHGDIYRDRMDIPSGEVGLMKDVLHHWPTHMVVNWLRWARACGKWKHLILTQDVQQPVPGTDCHLGGYRALDPRMEPLLSFKLRVVTKYLHKAVLLLDLQA